MPDVTVSLSHVGGSFSLSLYLAIMIADGCLRMIEAQNTSFNVRRAGLRVWTESQADGCLTSAVSVVRPLVLLNAIQVTQTL